MSKLTIYKASAGSGKTFTLALEYIRTILDDPSVFRNILAVTFTNKATREMKLRILEQLKKMAGEDQSDYLDILVQESGKEEQLLRTQAREALREILHHYSWFSVGTIDSFFQRIIRNFTRETGQTGNFSIELDDKRLIFHAIELLMTRMDRNEDLRKWLTNYALHNIEEGRSWELRNSMKDLAGQIVSEEYQEQQSLHSGSFCDRETLNGFIRDLHRIRSSFENELRSIAQEAIAIIRGLDLETEDFSGKSRSVAAVFPGIMQGKLDVLTGARRQAVDDFSKWAAKNAPKSLIIREAYDKGLRSCLQKIYAYFDENREKYNTAVRILKEVYNLGVLQDLSEELHQYAQEQNLFLISDAAAFLHGIIRDNEAPFIYEKAGNRYHHFMIDEFQDTSRLQWKNFKPLLSNSLAQGFDNLVVGDVKQSIYRWRNSDWDILAGEVEKAFPGQEVKIRPLLTNYRSREAVIRFNNVFFEKAAARLDEGFRAEAESNDKVAGSPPTVSLREAYADVVQEIPEKVSGTGGVAELNFLENNDEEHWMDAADRMLADKIKKLQENDYRAGDMAILVRSAAEGRRIARLLLETQQELPERSPYNFRVISGESLYVNASAAVRLLIAAMKYLRDPDDHINKAFLIYEYHFLHRPDQLDGKQLDLLLAGIPGGPSAEGEEPQNELPGELVQNRDQLRKLPLYELTERLIRALDLSGQKGNTPYLQAFLDRVRDYTTRESPALDTFLEWWEEHGSEQSVNISENQDAITILTIHKAKGLEFDVVLVPYCDWEMSPDRHRPVMWVRPREEPFSQMPILPVRYSSKLGETFFKQDYLLEKQKSLVDNLNLLYVAFTRAKDVLICTGPKSNNPDPLKHSGDLVYRVCCELQTEPGASMSNLFIDPADGTERFTSGEMPCAIRHVPSKQVNLQPRLESWTPAGRLSLRYDSAGFLEITRPEQALRINYGTLMHDLFKSIITAEDLQHGVEKMVLEGRIPGDVRQDLLAEARKALGHPVAREWFRPGWQVFPERSILTRAKGTLRPDRVMMRDGRTVVVDFKFGDKTKTYYNQQVRQYMSRLREMGHEQVEGYLWYVKLDQVEKINPG